MFTALLALALLSPTPQIEHAPPLARLVADDVPVFFELSNGSAFLSDLLDSELYRQVSLLPEWRAGLESGDLRQLKSGLSMFAGMLGRSIEEAAHQVLGAEVALALRVRPDGEPAVLLMTRTDSVEAAELLLEATHNFLTLVASSDNFVAGDRIRSVNGEEFHARIADTFLIANDRTLLEQALERGQLTQPTRREQQLGGSDPQSRPDPRPGRAVLVADLEQLRKITGQDGFPELNKNALGALLLGGLGAALGDAPQAVATLTGGADGVRLSVRLERALHELPEQLAWSFPEDAKRPEFPLPAGTIASFGLNRDFRAFYQARFELLDPALEADLLEFDNVISIFFGGRSFGEEVLPALGDHATVLVGRQEFADLKQAPEVQLPGFALITSVDESALRKSDLLMAFQTSVGLINGDRAQKGLSSLMINTERYGDVDVASARFLRDDEEQRPEFRFNTQPAMAVTQGTLIVGSSRQQVLSIIDAVRSGRPDVGVPSAGGNSALSIDTAALAAILGDNFKPLVASRMLEEGQTYEQAARFWERALRVVGLLKEAGLRVDRTAAGVEIQLSLKPQGNAADAETRR